MISNLHLIPTQATYDQQRYDEIRLLEGTNQGRPYLDTTGNPSVGIGFNLRGNATVRAEVFFRMEINPDAQGLSAAQRAAESSYLNQLNTAAAGSYASSSAVQSAFDAIMAVRAGDALFAGITRITSLPTFTMTDPQMQAVFSVAALQAESKVDAWLAGIPQSDERLALVSLAYNNLIGVNPGGTFKSSSLRQAIINDNRAEAWYEIRYQSNGGQSAGAGIANRRIAESNLFSLYDNSGQVSEAEAKEVLRMYTIHQPEIQDYESRFAAQFPTGGTNTVVFQIVDAKTTLIPIYNAGKSIDGEVLVGNAFSNTLDEYGRLVLDKSDLLFGEGGNDYLYGHGGTDVLYGGDGRDTLVGGTGNDHLEGGEGFDSYRWSTGDGHDRIEDSDAEGVIYVNGQMLVGGVKKAGHQDWVSADGSIRYEMSGTDLVVKLNGTQILTVNEDFQSGQFGIRLVDGPETPAYDNGRATQRLYAETGVEPDGPISVSSNLILYGSEGFDDLGAAWSWYLWNDQLYGYGGSDHIAAGLGHDRVYGGDGNDYIYGGIYYLSQFPDPWEFSTIDSLDGDDYLDGENGNDHVVGLSGDDRLFGGEGNDHLRGDGDSQDPFIAVPPGGDDALDGGVGEDTLIGDYGADILSGGDGDDYLRGDYTVHLRLSGPGEPFNTTVLIPFDSTRAQDDFLDGGAGNDELYGDGGDDTLVGGAGEDQLFGDYAGTYYVGVGGAWTDEAVFDEFGDDVLDGGDGDDLIFGMGGNDVLFGGADVDTMFGNDGADMLSGGDGNDALLGDSASDTSPGDDLLFGDAGFDLLQGEAGNDQLDGGEDDDELQGGSGHDALFGGTGNDLLFGEATSFQGPAGDDMLDGGDGIDQLQGGGGADTLFGGTGNDTLFGDDPLDVSIVGNDQLDGEAGDDELQGGLGNDTLFGGDGNDALRGDRMALAPDPQNGGDDSLDGEAGDDELNGDSGNDVLTGGTGQDLLIGGTGQDTYEFNLGDGVDTIEDQGGEGNRLVFGVNSESVTLEMEAGDTLQLHVGTAGDVVRITNFGVNVPAGAHPIENFEFSDGTVLTYSQLITRGFHQFGTVNSESLTGTGFIDHIAAGAGNDVVSGLGGADTLLGEDGNDVLNGDSGDDTLDGGAGNDQLFGQDGTDQLYGGVGDDRLSADLGTDQLVGGAGNDIYELFGSGHVIVEASGEGIDTVRVGIPGSFGLPDEVENIELREDTFFSGDVDLVGNQLNNQMTGSDLLDGRQGNDTLIGLGDNIYVFGQGYGQDIIRTGQQTYASQNFIDYIQLLAGVVPNDVTFEGQGNHLIMKIAGTSDQITVENYLIEPGLRTPTVGEIHFDDGTIWGEAEITDRVRVFTGTTGNDTLTGFNNDNDLFGLDGDDQLIGYGGADRLDGGAGVDVMSGGEGNDTYIVDQVGDETNENSNEGTDTVHSSITYTLGANVENLTLTGATAINGTGNMLNNVLTGNSATNVLTGGTGNDTYVVGTGDTVTEAASAGTDTVQSALTYTLGANLENLTLTGIADINGTGNTLNNSLTGNAGNNVLDGGTGSDTMGGGTGNDTYVVNATGDVTTENANEGADTVLSAVTRTLGANFENLTLTGTTAINGTGNTLDNVLTGNSAANVLAGGAGNDTYVVGTGDTVTEAAGAGTDTVQSAVTFTIGTNVENLTLTGTTAINGTGNALNNILIGNSGANTLSGGTGADAMTGGAGNDTYVVDNVGDTVTENLNEGTDLLQSAVTYTLAANVENLTLTGTTAINGTGNTLDNVLTGNSAANILTGGAGNDTYVVTTGDTVTEAVSAGTDTVQSGVTWTLGANLENLILTGTTAINGTGNTLDNVLTGNSAANVLAGGTGNDTYVVGTGDTVTEAASAGTDTVQSAITWTLGANLENLTLTGTTAINGTGNTLDNTLAGNSAANVLTGGTGNDTYVVGTGDTVTEAASAGTDTVQSVLTYSLGANLENLTLTGTAAINGTGNTLNNVLTGNSANNVLTGLGGNETYLYSRGGGQDTVVDNAGTADLMLFGATINPLDLVISRQVNDLRLSIHGSSDQVTIQNWYGGATNHTETIQAGNGQALLSTHVDQLIQAMASFTQQTGLTWDQAIDQQPQQVQNILAASWQ